MLYNYVILHFFMIYFFIKENYKKGDFFSAKVRTPSD